MNEKIIRWFKSPYPQNYILAHPWAGAVIIALFSISFTLLYRPVGAHEGQHMGYAATMLVYSIVSAGILAMGILLLKRTGYFAGKENWTVLKELLAIFLILLLMGIVVYFIAFFVEPPASRWNLSTLLDSVKRAFLVGIIPFGFFSLVNAKYLFGTTYTPGETGRDSEQYPGEEKLFIKSQLKKEKLSFYPSQFIYAEAEGNYIAFHLQDEKSVKKKTIRNSMNNIEEQLSAHPAFFRVHRAFIINITRVRTKKGNIAGYRLKLEGCPEEIPVSRQNAKAFEEVYEKHFPG